MLDEAILFATKAHEGQFRKGTKKPYIVHPLEVKDIVMTMTEDEEIICAAVLHDTMEDCKDVSEETIRIQFGERVAKMVAGESEDKTRTWEERKSATIKHLRDTSEELQMIALADKLSNLRDIDRDYPIFGEENIRDVLRPGFEGQETYAEYSQLVDKIFGKEPADESWREQ